MNPWTNTEENAAVETTRSRLYPTPDPHLLFYCGYAVIAVSNSV